MKPFFTKITGMALFTAFAMLSVVSCRDYDPTEDNEDDGYPQAGDFLPVMKLTTTEGESLKYGQLAGGNTLLVFFDLDCPDCIAELPVVEAFSKAHSGEVRTIAVGRGHTAGEITSYWQENGLSVLACADPEGAVYSLFASSGVPYIVAASDGEIVAILPGKEAGLPAIEDLEKVFGLEGGREDGDDPSGDEPSSGDGPSGGDNPSGGDGPSEVTYPKVGDMLPEISFSTTEGVSVKYRYICSGSTLLYFFSLADGEGIRELSVIDSFCLSHPSADGVKAFAIEIGHDRSEIESYWLENGLSVLACTDPEGSACAKISGSPLPCAVALSDGRIKAIYTAADGNLPTVQELESIFGLEAGSAE